MASSQLYRRFAVRLVFAVTLIGIVNPAGSSSAGVETPPPLKISAGGKAPDFTLKSAADNTVRLSQFAGHNVLIDFYRGYW
ncbi:MAG: redoxin domain-containing protein [Candidatus Acidiferrales bacterium]|jgi:cytochrome oxidase Cu insertion factor (SCO1/SenC/PrrC family)